jgi:2-oxoglutarate dehydrogenase E1 component
VSSQLTGVGSEEGSSSEFGANEWLVDELYEQYIADKNSVDKSWWPILEHYQKPSVSEASAAPAAEPTEASAAPSASAEAHPPTAPMPVIGTQPVAKTTSVAPKPQPVPAEAPVTAPQTVVPSEEDGQAPAQDLVTPLRGMAKSLATNMDSSLTVPTATSVRTIPA